MVAFAWLLLITLASVLIEPVERFLSVERQTLVWATERESVSPKENSARICFFSAGKTWEAQVEVSPGAASQLRGDLPVTVRFRQGFLTGKPYQVQVNATDRALSATPKAKAHRPQG
jgi:hypothetical protein